MRPKLGQYGVKCEQLWRDWLDERMQVSSYISDAFDVSAAPEPYLSFGARHAPLAVLTTNPGAVLPFQKLEAIRSGNGPVAATMSYHNAAIALGNCYGEHLKGAARRRIDNIRQLAELAGYQGVLQFECCPFHSARFPGKQEYICQCEEDVFIHSYVESLRGCLLIYDVLVVAAIGSGKSIRKQNALPAWLSFQMSLVGLSAANATMVPLVKNGNKTTCAALVGHHAHRLKIAVLMMGGNHLRGKQGLQTLADAIHAER